MASWDEMRKNHGRTPYVTRSRAELDGSAPLMNEWKLDRESRMAKDHFSSLIPHSFRPFNYEGRVSRDEEVGSGSSVVDPRHTSDFMQLRELQPTEGQEVIGKW